ncbi:MAG: deoxyguanosinetriphosphate triphosphohydrolase [Rhizobacter sp.]|nr:deoxyguanosinetriphosphate triphosphohydrolase [Rhizobacter sp.]
MLEPYACDPERSRGRRIREQAAAPGEHFRRDRDRIIHSTAFRRLVYKTQVFLNHEGDLFRTRLTHSIEVAQLGRTIAHRLGLNEDLVEAIALAHDLGHTPFGHAGQDALHECLVQSDPGGEGFEHNFQTLRVVDALEQRFPTFDGLNLSFETREGVLKHCSRRNAERLVATDGSGLGQRFIHRSQPSLEAQLCNLADQIAYNAHDVDDGVRSGLLVAEQLDEVPLLRELHAATSAEFPALADRRLLFETLRRMLASQVDDLTRTTTALLAQHAPRSADEARRMPTLVGFSEPMAKNGAQLKQFLRANLYRHPRVVETTDRARQVIRDLFGAYCNAPAEMPAEHARRPRLHRSVADYIAGMTDRFALREHHRITGRTLFD